MKKKVVIFGELLVLFLVIGSSIAMAYTGFSEKNKASKPILAPENPKFAKCQNQTCSTLSETFPDGHATGLIPGPVDLNHLKYSSTTTIPTPAYYDLRKINKVTTVKDQSNAGVCWTFATYGSLESYLMPEKTWAFSENNMKNLLSSAYPEGFDRSSNDGGNAFISTAYLVSWNGPMAESDDPYNPNSDVSPQNLPIQKHVQNMSFVPDRKGPLDNSEIKLAVQELRSGIYHNVLLSNLLFPYQL